MPLSPNLIERLVLFKLNRAPSLLLDFLGAESFRVFAAARKLGVFDALAGGARSVAEVAHEMKADTRGTALLLEALAAVGYVKQQTGRYGLTAMTAKWLPVFGDGIDFFEMLLERLSQLEQAVRWGGPAVDPREWLDQRPGGWRDFQAGMLAVARLAADEVAAKIKLPRTARRLLDVGGGHGLYSIKLCRRHPALSATIFDLPQALESARELIDAEKMADRVALRPGDFWTDDLGTGYDVALLFNIVHGHIAKNNVALLDKVAAALVRGGMIVILDQLGDKASGATARAVAALTGLALFNLAGGQAYGFEEIAGWLRSSGFVRLRRVNILGSPGSALIMATKT